MIFLKKNKKLQQEEEKLKEDKEYLCKSQKYIQNLQSDVDKLKNKYQEKLDDVLKILEHSTGLTQNEAKEIILKKVEENSREQIAHIVRKYEEEAKNEAKRKANFIIAQATSRFAGEFAAERLINVINIKTMNLKDVSLVKKGAMLKPWKWF